MEDNIKKIAKSMKKEFIEITPNYIFGTDINRQTMSIIYIGSPDYYIGTMGELDGKNPPDYKIYEELLKKEIDGIMKRTFDSLEGLVPIYTHNNLKEDESFVEILGYKAVDGANMYKLNDEFIMYMFSSMHPVNKPDTIYIEVFQVDSYSCIAHFIVDKKKYQIHEYIRYLYL